MLFMREEQVKWPEHYECGKFRVSKAVQVKHVIRGQCKVALALPIYCFCIPNI